MGKTLFIIGNGFDLYHELPTQYKEYKEFLKHHAKAFKEDYEVYPYFIDNLQGDRWSDVEATLELDYASQIQDALDDYYPKMTDDNPGWNDAEIDIENQGRFICDFTGELFVRWLASIDTSKIEPKILFPNSALFVTFNYTDTLETVYGVDSKNILHVHGAIREFQPNVWLNGNVVSTGAITSEDGLEAADVIVDRAVNNHDEAASRIQFGNPKNDPRNIVDNIERLFGDDDFYGVTIEPCAKLAARYAEAAFKNLAQNYLKLEAFLNSEPVCKVVVFGHSFDGIDKPYYERVLAPCFRKLPWAFTRYQEKPERIQTFCQQMGIEAFSSIDVDSDDIRTAFLMN